MFLQPRFWWIILIIIFLHSPFLFSGNIYRWTDEKGTVHFTDDPSGIPERLFEQAERIEVSEEVVKEVEKPGKPEGEPGRVKDYLEGLEKKIEVKRRMEKKVSELEEELRLSEERLKRIEEYEKEDFQYYLPYIDKRTGKLVPIASPYYEEKRGLERKVELIKAELSTLTKRISELTKGL